MPDPQQPELRRSETTPVVGEPLPGATVRPDEESGPVPEANLPGSPSGDVQDQPDMEAFRARFSGASENDESTDERPDDQAEVRADHERADEVDATDRLDDGDRDATAGSSADAPVADDRTALWSGRHAPRGLTVSSLCAAPLRITAGMLRAGSDVMTALATRIEGRR